MNGETVGRKETGISKHFENKKSLLLIATGIAVLLALVAGIGIYNTPTNRLNRHLEMANKYLAEMHYEQAVVEFDKAIEIDPMSAAAYSGKAEAYVRMGDYGQAVETLEAGYLATQENGDVKNRLIAIYKEMLGDADEAKRYEEKLAIYDRLIELDGHDRDVLEGLESCLEQYIRSLLEEEKSDEIRALIKKYKDILAGTDFDAFVTQTEMCLREIAYRPLLKAAQDVILTEDYEQLNTLVQEQEYQDMITSLQPDESYYYGERDSDGKRDGVGIAVCKDSYITYFYYGSWIEGERSGQGQAVRPMGGGELTTYAIYTGEWAYDLPNGYGEEIRNVIQGELKDGVLFDSLYRGFLKNGLFDGEIYVEMTRRNGVEGYTAIAKNGAWEVEEDDYAGTVVRFTPVSVLSTPVLLKIEDNKNRIGTLVTPSS